LDLPLQAGAGRADRKISARPDFCETVSRTFTQLVQSGTIAFETSRRIEFRNRAELSRLNV
jgi:hypothetical protein